MEKRKRNCDCDHMHLKRIIGLSKTMCYQFQRITYLCSIAAKSICTKTQMTRNKKKPNPKNLLKRVLICVILSKKIFKSVKSLYESSVRAKNSSRSEIELWKLLKPPVPLKRKWKPNSDLMSK